MRLSEDTPSQDRADSGVATSTDAETTTSAADLEHGTAPSINSADASEAGEAGEAGATEESSNQAQICL